jgi:alanine racemase
VTGIAAALDLLDQQKQHRQKAVILSDLLETGRDETELYGEIARLIGQREVSLFTGIGPAMMRNRDLFTGNSIFFEDTDGFIKRMDRTRLAGASVLIKGSRKFGFERITSELQLQTHQTRLEIDLNAMVGNLNYFRSLLGDGVKVMVMVKALSYGSGSVEIASLLQFHKVDYLAVAFIDEGIELRKAGIHMPIMVMNPDPAGYGPMVDYRLEPEIYSYRGLDALEKLLRYREVSKYPIHLKIDTGMHRLGFSMSDVEHLAGRAGAGPFRVTSIFSHLAASDEEEQDAFTHHQIEIFERACKQFADLLGHRPDRHILNSSGIERFPEARFEMVRLGIGLHGIGRGESLTPVSTYRTAISQIREVEAGETVGYSRSGKILRKTRVATLPVGYADGLDRRLGNGKGHVWLKDHLAPVLGNICMDMTMIDVTGIPAEEGDSVEIFGKQLPVTELARIAGTIPYEILTSVPERVKRIYLQE